MTDEDGSVDSDLWDDFDLDDSAGTVSQKPPPVVRAPAVVKANEAAAAKAAADAAQLAAQTAARRVAQVANLLISGHTIESVAASIGATPDEVESMLNNDSARYIRTQPALRQWVRRYLSGKYTDLLDAVWDQAIDKNHRDQLAYQDRARPILDRLAKLHGAEAPTQAEIKMDATPESVQKIVDQIAAAQGLGYDVDIFAEDPNVVDADLVHDAHQDALLAIEQAAQVADHDIEGDGPL